MYRLVMDDATTAIAYLWDDAENYWPAAEGDDDLTDPFSPGLGLDLFEAAHARLHALGVHVPAIRLVDRDGACCPADLAIVEDLPGETLEQLLARDARAAAPVMTRLGEALDAMRRHRAPTYGKASSAMAVHLACADLLRGECELAVAGGV
ncbi:beta-ketoacyl synthase N-terminal-like domain-containing protein, partial [Streptomyces sp. NPDC002143]